MADNTVFLLAIKYYCNNAQLWLEVSHNTGLEIQLSEKDRYLEEKARAEWRRGMSEKSTESYPAKYGDPRIILDCTKFP